MVSALFLRARWSERGEERELKEEVRRREGKDKEEVVSLLRELVFLAFLGQARFESSELVR